MAAGDAGRDAERIEALEMRIAYQDQTIEDLSDAVAELWKAFERLGRRAERLEAELREAVEARPGKEAPEPPPPHY